MSDETRVEPPSFMEVDGRRIAYRERDGAADVPGLVWLGGWRSDMLGSKAETLDALCAERGWRFLRLDYSGHGESDGRIEDGTISRWTDEARAVVEARAGEKPLVLCGSSMGAWIALRLALAWRGTDRLRGLILIAPAPDFVTRLMEPRLTDAQRREMDQTGRIEEPSEWAPEPNVWTREFMEDGARAAVLTGPLELDAPVHILQGTDDAEVPLEHAELLLSHLPADEATMTVVRGGDHRLSREEDLDLLRRVALGMVEARG